MANLAFLFGSTARGGEALKPEFRTYQQQIIKNAAALASELAAKKIRLISGGTDNHLMILDLVGTGVTGKELQDRLDSVHITTNKEAIRLCEKFPIYEN